VAQTNHRRLRALPERDAEETPVRRRPRGGANGTSSSAPTTVAWHLIGDNGVDIIATDGGQGYSRADDAADIMKKIRSGHYATCPMEPH